MFSHNGRLTDLDRARKALWAHAAEVPEAQVGVDSAWLFGAAVGHWVAGSSLAEGLVAATRSALEAGGGRVSLLATDGYSVAASPYVSPGVAERTAASTQPDETVGARLANEASVQIGWARR
jgi:hypothetical protein